MAIAPKCACQVRRSHVTFTPGKRGWTPMATSASQNIEFVGPTQPVGVDATPFTLNVVNGRATATLPFYNLPTWTRGNPLVVPNQLRPFRNQLRSKQTFVQPMNQLFFDAQPMNITGPHGMQINCTPQAIDTQNVTAVGPYIGGGRSYKNWQVIITALADKSFTGKVSGTVVARLHHIFG